MISFAILFNNRAKTKNKGDAMPTPLSMNELNTEYWKIVFAVQY